MRNHCFPIVVLFALLVFLVPLGGCSENDPADPAPEVETYLHGVVTDADGEPLAGISIGLIYDLPGLVQPQNAVNIISRPEAKPMTKIAFDLPEPANVRVWITDYAGNHVITLVDAHNAAGEMYALWSAVDESGTPVPCGMYYAHIQVEDQEPDVHPLFLLFLDPSDFLRHPNAITDENGEFRIPDSLIPIGETIEVVDETGTLVDQVVITTQLAIRAVREGTTDTEWTGLTIEYLTGGANGELELTLP